MRSFTRLPVLLPAALAAAVALAEPAPDIEFHEPGGTPHRLSELRGGVVVLDFWASWCAPCRESFPFLDGLREKHEASGVRIVALTLEEDDRAVEAFLERYPTGLLIGRDPSGVAGELFEVVAMPTTLLIDADGAVAARFEGGGSGVHEELEHALERLLRGETLDGAGRVTRRPGGRGLRAWERGYLADPIMNLDGDVLTRSIKEHIHASKEGAAGDGGVAGGGCGCN